MKADGNRFFALKNWDAICKPKKFGGIGFRRFADFNLALIAKLGWKLLFDDNAIWVKALKAKYCRK